MHLLVLVVALVATSCDSDTQSAEAANGWVTNCSGSQFNQLSPNGHIGPGPDRPVFRINDQLVLAVPQQHRPSTRIDHQPRECRQIADVPKAPFLSFVISGNWSGDYSSADIPIVGVSKQFQPDVVTVRIEPETSEKSSVEDQQKMKQLENQAQRDNYVGTREIGGLTCSIPKPPLDFFHCSGHRSKDDPDVVSLRYRDYAATPFFLLQAQYISSRYGGIRVHWQAWTLDLSHALDIDAAIWKSIEDWNLKSAAPPDQH